MKKISSYLLAFSALLLIFSCSPQDDRCAKQPDTSNINIDLQFEQTETALMQDRSKAGIQKFLEEHPAFATLFLKRGQQPHDSILVNDLYHRINHPSFLELKKLTDSTFNQVDLKGQFEQAFRNIKFYYPAFQAPRIITGITGFDTNFQGLDDDLYVSDSLIVIGLDYFLGPQSKYRPIGIPEYILKRYTPTYIVPSVLNQMANKYIGNNPKDHSLLADMIFFGKAFYFTKTMAPCTPDSVIIGYTAEELQESKDHSQIIWANLVKNKMLYETGHEMKKKFIGERPKTIEMGEKCPGRIGQWVGWEIVEKYMQARKHTHIQDFLKTDSAPAVLAKSKYKG